MNRRNVYDQVKLQFLTYLSDEAEINLLIKYPLIHELCVWKSVKMKLIKSMQHKWIAQQFAYLSIVICLYMMMLMMLMHNVNMKLTVEKQNNSSLLRNSINKTILLSSCIAECKVNLCVSFVTTVSLIHCSFYWISFDFYWISFDFYWISFDFYWIWFDFYCISFDFYCISFDFWCISFDFDWIWDFIMFLVCLVLYLLPFILHS